MCLYYSQKETENLKAKLRRRKEVTFYKELAIAAENSEYSTVCIKNIHGAVSPYRGTRTVLKNGYLVSNRKTIKTTSKELDQGINKGIHVYTAKLDNGDGGPFNIVVPVTGRLSDFVAADQNQLSGKNREAVFTKVKIDKNVLKKHIIRVIKEHCKSYLYDLPKATMEKGIILFYVIEDGKMKAIREDIKTFKISKPKD